MDFARSCFVSFFWAPLLVSWHENGDKIFSAETKLEFGKPLPSREEEYKHSWKYVYVHLKLSLKNTL